MGFNIKLNLITNHKAKHLKNVWLEIKIIFVILFQMMLPEDYVFSTGAKHLFYREFNLL